MLWPISVCIWSEVATFQWETKSCVELVGTDCIQFCAHTTGWETPKIIHQLSESVGGSGQEFRCNDIAVDSRRCRAQCVCVCE
jgi:hypothetical protein